MILRISIITTLLPFLFSCTITLWKGSATVVDKSKLVVETERLYEYDSPSDGLFTEATPVDSSYSHPVDVSPEVFAVFLSDIKYEVPSLIGDTTYTPVFQKDIVPVLALSISKGLKVSGSSDRIRFRVRNIRHSLGVIPQGRITRGVVFVQPEGILNIAFDLIDADPDEIHAESSFDIDWEDPTSHIISHEILNFPEEASFFFDSEQKKHPLWIIVPVEMLTIENYPVEAGKNLSDRGPENQDKDDTEPEDEKQTESSEEVTGDTEKKQEKLSDQDIISRLKYLKELKSKGMISDEEYQKECKEIMDNF